MALNRLFEDLSHKQTYPIVLLDGGLGTTLEDIFHKDITHPLWSARLVDEDDASIVAAHLAFLRAGSRVILTSTYQGAYETFRRAGYADSDAERLMRKSVRLATEARGHYELETAHAYSGTTSMTRPRPRIALSLGPYGATLETAAEFTGLYPPPYGSSLPPSHGARGGPATFSEEQSREDALAAFHFSRLLVYALDADTWDAIDLVAFETVPLVSEARAIRRAVARIEDWFQETCNQTDMKPWYISFVFPGRNGEFPQVKYAEDPSKEPRSPADSTSNVMYEGEPYSPREVAHAALLPRDNSLTKMATPNAIGINCTKIAHVFRIAIELGATVSEIMRASPDLLDTKPWLVLCPNGGAEYDTVERTWAVASPNTIGGWARSVGDSLLVATQDSEWCFGGLLLGGCCKTGPSDIHALEEIISAS